MLTHRALCRTSTSALRRPYSAAFSTSQSHGQDKVQTPFQSQKKDKIAQPGYQPAESITFVQTPLQSQISVTCAPVPAPPHKPNLRDPGPLFTLIGGLLAGSVFVYYYYEQRKDHMERKWAAMLKEAEEMKSAGG